MKFLLYGKNFFVLLLLNFFSFFILDSFIIACLEEDNYDWNYGMISYFFPPNFPFGSFYVFFSFGELIFFSCIVFLILLSCLFVFLCSSLSIFIKMILNYLLGNSCISFLCGSVTGDLLCSFGGFTFSWFFLIPVALHRCLYIWRTSNLFQNLWTDLSKKCLSPEAHAGCCDLRSTGAGHQVLGHVVASCWWSWYLIGSGYWGPQYQQCMVFLMHRGGLQWF